MFLNLEEIPEKEPVDGFRVRFVHSESMTLAYWNARAGATVPEHSHPHEQVVNMIEGHLELSVGDEKRVVEPGQVVVIPSGVPHSATALTECRILDAFHPVREDYR